MPAHPLRCRCGTLQGHVALPATTSRAICYCRDCQAYGRWLERCPGVLDAAGGTDIVATVPRHVAIEQGQATLACVSLSSTGLLRWYAECCGTPIGNTPRDRRTAYVGLVHSCLDTASLDSGFGPPEVHLNTGSARHAVPSTGLGGTLAAMVRLTWAIVPCRFNGRYRENPFFDATRGEPLRMPRVLPPAEVAALRDIA